MTCASSPFTCLAAAALASVVLGARSAAWRPVCISSQSSALAARNLRLADGGGGSAIPTIGELAGPGRSIVVSESSQGGLDLNGDGDAKDRVLHLAPQVSGPLLDLGLAVDYLGPELVGKTIALGVSEFDQGAQDLNADGDVLDSVLHLVDASSGAVVNVGLALRLGSLRLSDSFAAFAVNEAAQGGVDLNGDGDALDHVLHHVALASGSITNVGLAVDWEEAAWVDLDGSVMVGYANEAAQGQDFDGDGVLDDMVPHAIDPLQGGTFVLASAANTAVVVSGGFVAYRSLESSVGTDLNGDGDLLDTVLQVLDVGAGTTANTGLSSGWNLLARGAYVAFDVSESMQGQSLNADADQSDLVAHVLHLPTATAFNTGLALGTIAGLSGTLLSLHVAESLQGGQDLNGDGDAVDRVLHVVDMAQGLVANVGLQSDFTTTGARLIGFQVRESSQGAQDLNGDGDLADLVWHVYDALQGTTTNLGVGTSGAFFLGLAGEDFLLFTALESSSGSQDLNGDGDTLDSVLHLQRAGQALENLELAVFEHIRLSRRRVFLPVREAQQANVDLNGDGDALDQVFHVLDVP